MSGSIISVTRYHDISCGHRVVGHEGKCVGLHGHNYRIHFTCVPEKALDAIGRVIDFSVIKTHLCEWLENSWDHRMLLWEEDPLLRYLPSFALEGLEEIDNSIVTVSFNPTAENMAAYLLHKVGPMLLTGTGAMLMQVTVDETRKCSASASSASRAPVVYEDQMDWSKSLAAWNATKSPGHTDLMLSSPEAIKEALAAQDTWVPEMIKDESGE